MKRSRRTRGFTLIELMVVIAIISILMSMVLVTISIIRKNIKISAAKMQMKVIAMGLAQYQSDLRAIPPDNVPTTSGSEVLCHALTRRMKVGSMHYGPYFEPKILVDRDKNGIKEITSPLNTEYYYVVLLDDDGTERGCLAVDPGPDKLLGGVLTPSGFVSSGMDANGDGDTDDADNIFSSESGR